MRPDSVDQEQRRPGDVPGIETETVPDAVRLHHLARDVEQDVEGEPCVFDVAPHYDRRLCDDGDDLDAARGVFTRPFCQFTEPALAVGSPGAAMEREQQRTFREIGGERAQLALLVRELERWSSGQR